jgi:hypothetical protein
MLHAISGALDASGALVSLSHRVVSPSHMLYIMPRGMFLQLKDWTDPAAPPEKMDTMAVEGLLEIPYDIPRQQVEQHRLELDIPVSVWRTTGHGPNNFVLESFIDELAFAAEKDPVVFRRPLLEKDRRARNVLDLVAAKSGWGDAAPARASRDIACAKAFGGYVAAVAEVSMAGANVKVRHLTLAVDCGKVLDPGISTSNILAAPSGACPECRPRSHSSAGARSKTISTASSHSICGRHRRRKSISSTARNSRAAPASSARCRSMPRSATPSSRRRADASGRYHCPMRAWRLPEGTP